jgi:flagellar basal body P-ring formation protein FlgA
MPVGTRAQARRGRIRVTGALAAGVLAAVIGLGPAAWAGARVERVARIDRVAPEAPLVVNLRPESTVRGPEIRLGEIAEVQGGEAEMVERLRAIEVGRAPLPGLSRTLDLAYLKARLRLAGVDPASLVLDFPQTVSIITASQQVTGTELLAAVREQLLAARPDEAGRLSIQPAGAAPGTVTVPAGHLELKVRTRPGADLFGSISATVEAWVDGAMVRSISVPVRVSQQAEILVAARTIGRATPIGPDDVRVERRELTTGQEPLRALGALLGRQAVRNIVVGEPILASLLEQPPLVRRGDMVVLTAEARGIRAVTQGEAKEDGKAGQVIRVRNLTSNREVYGQVDAERSVRVAF